MMTLLSFSFTHKVEYSLHAGNIAEGNCVVMSLT